MALPPRIRRLIYSAAEVLPDVFLLTIRTNNVLVIFEEKITLVDTGFKGSTDRITGFIESRGRSPRDIGLVILTHNHPDHTGGLKEIRNISNPRVAMHHDDILQTGEAGTADGRRQKPVPLLQKPFYSSSLGKIDIRLSGGETLEPLGGLEVIHTPGHTPGSISLYSEKHRLMIAGDALRNRGGKLYLPPGLVSADSAQARESIKKIAGFEFEILCTGHGRPHFGDARSKVQELAEQS
jgi:glyoxylase-like metal-dependent hydrolase (beta-lactamase superfamily II)